MSEWDDFREKPFNASQAMSAEQKCRWCDNPKEQHGPDYMHKFEPAPSPSSPGPEPICTFQENGEVCGKILRASHYRHTVVRGRPIEMLNHKFQPAAASSGQEPPKQNQEKTMSKQAPILTEPFTHEQVDEYYADMYRHVVANPKPPLDFKTLVAVHNFFEFEANSGMMLDAWLHAELQKVTGTSYLRPEEENKEEKYGW